MFGEVENVANKTTINGKWKDRIRSVAEDIANFQAGRMAYTNGGEGGAAEWSMSVEEEVQTL